MIALNRPSVRLSLDICLARLEDPEMSVVALAELFDCSEGRVQSALKWGNNLGYFSDDAKRRIMELDAQRTERARYYLQQLRYIRSMRRRAKKELAQYLRLRPDVPEDPKLAKERMHVIDKYKAEAMAYAREESTYEAMIQRLEDSQSVLENLRDNVEPPSALPRGVKVLLIGAGGNGSHGTS